MMIVDLDLQYQSTKVMIHWWNGNIVAHKK